MNTQKLIVKPFKPVWIDLKRYISWREQFLFEEVVQQEALKYLNTFPSKHARNSRYTEFWFPKHLCHWNVILPCYMLNTFGEDLYQIITTPKHSAIINLQYEIYDPTYIEYSDPQLTISSFELDYRIVSVEDHCKELDPALYDRFMAFLDIIEQNDKSYIQRMEALEIKDTITKEFGAVIGNLKKSDK